MQQSVRANSLEASSHCSTRRPRNSMHIWPLEAQHHTEVSWPRSVTGCEPSGPGSQHPLAKAMHDRRRSQDRPNRMTTSQVEGRFKRYVLGDHSRQGPTNRDFSGKDRHSQPFYITYEIKINHACDQKHLLLSRRCLGAFKLGRRLWHVLEIPPPDVFASAIVASPSPAKQSVLASTAGKILLRPGMA